MQYTITVNGVTRPLNLALYICELNPTNDNKLLMGEMRLCGINYDDLDKRYFHIANMLNWGDITDTEHYCLMNDLCSVMLDRINNYLPEDCRFGCGGINSIGGNKIGYWQWTNELMGE